MPLVHTLPAPGAHIHLIGIAGTAMGALAVMLKARGFRVTGSDTAIYPPMSDVLAHAGIPVQQGFLAAHLDDTPDLVVIGNVVRREYEEATAVLTRDLPYTSLPSLLGTAFLAPAHSIVVAGTHGKTTTTAITAWLLQSAGLEPGYLIGGVAKNFAQSADAGGGQTWVIEGDEYDTAFFDKVPKFTHYHPKTAILTSVEFDHADIYADLDAVRAAFASLVALMPADGLLIARGDDPNVRTLAAQAACEVWRYGPNQMWDGEVRSVDREAGTATFTVTREGTSVGTFTSCLVGEHNLYNQVAACAVAISRGLDAAQIARGFATFQGIKRRQELLGQPGHVAVIDDFAHHPTAVRVTLDALRMRFGRRKLWAVFEPRSATSRRDVFQEAYASAFDEADAVVIAPPHDTSRIAPEHRFDAAGLVRAITARGVDATLLHTADEIAQSLAAQAQPWDVIAVLSNGGFGGLHAKLLTALQTRFPTDAEAP